MDKTSVESSELDDVLGKNKNMGRIMRTAFFMGFFWNEIIGRILG